MQRERILHITAKDFDITHIKGSGPGGQHRNKTSTGVRMRHKASGAVAEATDDRSQHVNKVNAFKRCTATPEFQRWFKIAVAEANGQPSIAQRVDEAMAESNIETQVLIDGKWVQVDPGRLTEYTEDDVD